MGDLEEDRGMWIKVPWGVVDGDCDDHVFFAISSFKPAPPRSSVHSVHEGGLESHSKVTCFISSKGPVCEYQGCISLQGYPMIFGVTMAAYQLDLKGGIVHVYRASET